MRGKLATEQTAFLFPSHSPAWPEPKMKRVWKAPSQVRQREATGDTGATTTLCGVEDADIVCTATTAAIEDVMLAFIVKCDFALHH